MNAKTCRPRKVGFFRSPIWRLTPAATELAQTRHAPDIRAKKILIIDDDAVILKTTSLKLESEGYEVVTATDGSEAIGAMRDQRPDLVLLDITFPPDIAQGGRVTWDGFQIMCWLRGLKEAKDVPFIIITGGDPDEYEERSLAHGALAFFHKPIHHEDLLPLIETTLS
jgi:chemosensory pili system protein ChpA (sensor histidine kinase/response regulator)